MIKKNKEKCVLCESHASHKIEESIQINFNPLTAYLCCECFGHIFGVVAKIRCEKSEMSNEFCE